MGSHKFLNAVFKILDNILFMRTCNYCGVKYAKHEKDCPVWCILQTLWNISEIDSAIFSEEVRRALDEHYINATTADCGIITFSNNQDSFNKL